MRAVAVINQIESDLRDRKFTGRIIITLDYRDGGVGRIGAYEASRVPKGSAVMMSNSGSDVLREIRLG